MAAWTIIYYSHTDFTHVEHIRSTNPDAQLLLLNTQNSLPSDLAWRSGDRLVRNALRPIFSAIKNENVLLIEWDVLLTSRLPDIRLTGASFRTILTPQEQPDWMWWGEFKKLPTVLQRQSIGGSPFGVLAIDKASLWKTLDPRFDEVFELDVFSEVRFPSVCTLCGIPLGPLDPGFFLPDRILSSTTPREITEFMNRLEHDILTVPGLYHPVKQRVQVR